MVLDNANPTILDVSELASHRKRRENELRARSKDTVMEILEDNYDYSMDPYYISEVFEPERDYDTDESGIEPIDEQEIYDLVAPISDPEHPLSLESLGVVKLQDVHLSQIHDHLSPITLTHVLVELTPTVTHCSLATVIGLGVRVRLEQALPPSYRVEVKIKKDTHTQAEEVSKQLADKERVAAALENESLLSILKKMLKPCLNPMEN